MSQEEFEGWKSSQATRQFKFWLAQRAERYMEQWATACLQHEEPYETSICNAIAIGKINLIREILEMEFEDVTEDEYE